MAKAGRSGLIAPGKQDYGRLMKSLRRVAGETREAVGRGMYAAMQPTMQEAKDRAPKDTTAMARSGYVTEPKYTGTNIGVESGFGGMAERYVVRQHEDTSLNHPNGGEAKFFERALDNNHNNIRDTIMRYVREFIRNGMLPPKAAKAVPTSPLEDRV